MFAETREETTTKTTSTTTTKTTERSTTTHQPDTNKNETTDNNDGPANLRKRLEKLESINDQLEKKLENVNLMFLWVVVLFSIFLSYQLCLAISNNITQINNVCRSVYNVSRNRNNNRSSESVNGILDESPF